MKTLKDIEQAIIEAATEIHRLRAVPSSKRSEVLRQHAYYIFLIDAKRCLNACNNEDFLKSQLVLIGKKMSVVETLIGRAEGRDKKKIVAQIKSDHDYSNLKRQYEIVSFLLQ